MSSDKFKFILLCMQINASLLTSRFRGGILPSALSPPLLSRSPHAFH